jgi:ATP-binding cassette subfamily F protein 3
VLFTSHDRHFVGRIATNVIEVRDGRARNYGGNYEAYLYSVNQEIDEGERERAQNKLASTPAGRMPDSRPAVSGKEQHNMRRQVRNLEKKIAKLDGEKKELNAIMLKTADADEALKLHHQIETLQKELADTENTWYELQVELGEF